MDSCLRRGSCAECDDADSDYSIEGGPVLASPVTGMSGSDEPPALLMMGLSRSITEQR